MPKTFDVYYLDDGRWELHEDRLTIARAVDATEELETDYQAAIVPTDAWDHDEAYDSRELRSLIERHRMDAVKVEAARVSASPIGVARAVAAAAANMPDVSDVGIGDSGGGVWGCSWTSRVTGARWWATANIDGDVDGIIAYGCRHGDRGHCACAEDGVTFYPGAEEVLAASIKPDGEP